MSAAKPGLRYSRSWVRLIPWERRDALDAFLDQKVGEGYVVETRTDTHAIISRRLKGLKRFTSGADAGRCVVEVDEDGRVAMRPAEPRRA